MQEALIGFAGLLLGLLISEYFRRSSRIETYAKEVFQKRLKVYEKLFQLISHARDISTEVIDSTDLTKEQRKEIWTGIVMKMANFNDKNQLHLNDEISLHSLMTLIGVEDIFYIEDKKEKENKKQEFRDNCTNLIEMIRNESGLQEISKHFGSITKAKHSSDYIEAYREMKTRYEKKGREGFEEITED